MVATEQGTRVELSLIDLTTRRDCVTKECYIMLYSTHFEYKVVGTYEVLDDDKGIWEHKTANYRFTRRKETLVDVAMYMDNLDQTWVVEIECAGVSNPTCWHWRNPKDALVVYKQLQQYLLQ